ncbi:MAG: cell division protein ZapA [Tannerellaceae bacterium]|jgi:cell division protein ZapA|nr:cell division protein ZapA [Tannerellaceae bacterium]
MNNEKFLIHIDIADKTYPLRIYRKDEEMARKAAKQIKNLAQQYGAKYLKSVRNDKDILAMVAFQLSVEKLQQEERNDTTPFIDKIQQMIHLMETCLDDNK